MTDREKVIEDLESLRDICNAKSNMAIGIGKIAWAGYANTASDALALLKEQPDIVECKDCMYYDNDILECKNDDFDILIHHCGCYPAFTPGPNWFCAYGERAVKSDE